MAGHAGLEAALASSGWELRTALLTINVYAVGQMSCNPAIGGVAKGAGCHGVDALGGDEVITDATAIQFRLLNQGKGPAMHSPRAQADKKAYQALAKLTVERQERLTLRQEMVEGARRRKQPDRGRSLRGRDPPCSGRRGHDRHLPPGAHAYRRGQDRRRPSRRHLERRALRQPPVAQFDLKRFKTSTPPRLSGRTIDFSKVEPQPGDAEPIPCAFLTDRIEQAQAQL